VVQLLGSNFSVIGPCVTTVNPARDTRKGNPVIISTLPLGFVIRHCFVTI